MHQTGMRFTGMHARLSSNLFLLTSSCIGNVLCVLWHALKNIALAVSQLIAT